ncbi:MAG: two-component system response regulator AtoC [Planctomycetota bacterium]|jgi:two-component system response regulator AtoC
MAALVLIADDEDGVRFGLVALCQQAGYRTIEAASGREVLEQVATHQPDLVLLDLNMPHGSGLDILPQLVEPADAPSVVILTGFADVGTAVQAMRLGADNLLEKPVSSDDLREVIDRILVGRCIKDERDLLLREVSELRPSEVIGHSPAMRRVFEHVERLAKAPSTTVLITGESGVGKELIARAVHDRSNRAEQPFVAINCAALAENLLEAELFGYEPGAFTGGNPKGHKGLIASAGHGTVFLDEIGELAAPLQAKLLRLLQERTYRRVGGNSDQIMQARIVAATNRDLVTMAEEGSFREDLYYRLNVLSIIVPPLRQRPEDIAPLAVHFLAAFGEQLARTFSGFSEGAMDRLRGYNWPGNVRELRNTVERAALFATGGMIPADQIELESRPAPSDPAHGTLLPMPSNKIKDMERFLIEKVINDCDGNRSLAARELGINRTTLYNKLREYGQATE